MIEKNTSGGTAATQANNAGRPASLVHIAVRTENAPVLGRFYESVFGMKVARTERTVVVDLWDGQVFLALNPVSRKGERGLDHFGFLVKDVDSLRLPLQQAGGSTVAARPPGRSFTDWRVHDPEGNPIDLSARGYNTVPPETLRQGNDAAARINRFAIVSRDPFTLRRFYETVFAMETARETQDAVVLTDGAVQLVLLSDKREPTAGLHSYGFRVTDLKKTVLRLGEMGISVNPGADQQDRAVNPFYFRDPAGNLVTLSE